MYWAYAAVSTTSATVEPLVRIEEVEAVAGPHGSTLYRLARTGEVRRLEPLLDDEVLVETRAEAESHCARRLEEVAAALEGAAAACRRRAGQAEAPT